MRPQSITVLATIICITSGTVSGQFQPPPRDSISNPWKGFGHAFQSFLRILPGQRNIRGPALQRSPTFDIKPAVGGEVSSSFKPSQGIPRRPPFGFRRPKLSTTPLIVPALSSSEVVGGYPVYGPPSPPPPPAIVLPQVEDPSGSYGPPPALPTPSAQYGAPPEQTKPSGYGWSEPEYGVPAPITPPQGEYGPPVEIPPKMIFVDTVSASLPPYGPPPSISQLPQESPEHLNVIFVKAPVSPPVQTEIVLPPQEKSETKVYVLTKQPDDQEHAISIHSPPPKAPQKPSVFFIRYAENAGASQFSEFNRVLERIPEGPSIDGTYAPHMAHSGYNYGKREVGAMKGEEEEVA